MEEPCYITYLLRLWPVKDGGETVWRASLESGLTGRRVGFSDLETLYLFLEQTLQTIQLSDEAQKDEGLE